MTKKERIQHQKRIKEIILSMRAEGKKYEEIAVGAGISIDTLRRMMYAKDYLAGEITIRKIYNFLQRVDGERRQV